jgi:hypothetical protein
MYTHAITCRRYEEVEALHILLMCSSLCVQADELGSGPHPLLRQPGILHVWVKRATGLSDGKVRAP